MYVYARRKENPYRLCGHNTDPSLYHFKTQHPVWVNNSGSACAATIVFDLETQLCWDQQFGADQSLWREEKNTFINVKYQI